MVARALCCSSAASWSRCTRLLQLWRRQISCEARLLAPPRGFRRMAFASPLRISYVHFATRELQRCFIVKLCPPLRKMVSTSRTRLPLRLAYRAGQRSYVKLLRGRREEPGNEAIRPPALGRAARPSSRSRNFRTRIIKRGREAGREVKLL